MSLQKTKGYISHISDMIDFVLNGKGKINKMDNHSDYQNSIYTPEDILGQIKYDVEQALKEIDKLLKKSTE